MRFKHIAALLRMVAAPGMIRVYREMKSCIRFHFIHSAIESGLLEALRKPRKSEELLRLLHVTNGELLHALLDVGVSIGELSFENGQYGIRGKTSKSVLTEKGDGLGALIQANVTYYNSAYRNIASRMRGAELSDDLGRIGGLVARASKIQEPVTRHFIREVASSKKKLNLLEIGCGSGAFMKTVHEANSDASGIGIDCDLDVVRQAQENMARWGIKDRFKLIHGDIKTFELEEYGPFDFISLYNVLYYFTPDEQIDLLRKLHSNMSREGSLAIVTTTRSNGKDPLAANLNLVNCSLKGVTAVPHLARLQEILTDSGFETVEAEPLLPGSTVYFMLAQ